MGIPSGGLDYARIGCIPLLLLLICAPIISAEEIWFGDAIQTAVPDRPRDLAVGYLNQDPFLDVAIFIDDGHDGWVDILFGDGAGHFVHHETYLAGENNHGGSIGIGDLNSDGAADIATVDAGNYFCRIRYNDGFGNFSGSEDLIPVQGDGCVVRVGDLDDDTHNDLVVMPEMLMTYIYWGTEDGPETEPDRYEFHLSPNPSCLDNQPRDCLLADLTGDGLTDLVGLWNEYDLLPECGPAERGLSLLRNLGGREFGPEPEWLVREVLGTRFNDLGVADLDNDEDLDVAISHRGNTLRTFLNTGDGHLIEGTGLGLVAAMYVALGDLNSDENMDIAWSQPVGGWEMKVWAGDGADNFTFVQTLDNPLEDIEAAEIDVHPGLDLIGFGEDVLTVFPNITYLDPSSVDEPGTIVTPSLMVWPTVVGTGSCVIQLSFDSDAAVPGIEILDVLGRRCATLDLGSGSGRAHSVGWDGRDDHGRWLPSGIYWIRPQMVGDIGVKVLLVH